MAVSSSRRSVVKAGLIAVFGGEALACARRAEGPSPWLVAEPMAAHEDQAAEARAAAFWLTVGSLSPAALGRFVDALDEIIGGVETSVNPLGIQLEDDSEAALRAFRSFLPQLNAAFAVSASSWPLPGERSRVRASKVAPAAGGGCRAWGRETEGGARRLRFAAWPVSDAVWIRASSRSELDTLLTRLRAQTSLDASAVGALVTSEMQRTFEKAPRRQELLELAARGQRIARRAKQKSELSVLALSPIDQAKPSVVAPWLGLGSLECLVVPRLATPSRKRTLAGVLASLTSDLKVEQLSRTAD